MHNHIYSQYIFQYIETLIFNSKIFDVLIISLLIGILVKNIPKNIPSFFQEKIKLLNLFLKTYWNLLLFF